VCGRFAYFVPTEQLVCEYQLRSAPEFAAHYNVAPSQSVVAIRQSPEGDRQASLLRWGLVPHWAKDPSIGSRMINARAETLAQKPAFRQAFKRRRCIIPVSGFYEWGPSRAGKWPYFVSAKDSPLLSLAGLWEQWSGGGEFLESCTVVTVAASPQLEKVHERMPLCLPESAYRDWLDPQTSADDCLSLVESAAARPDLDIRPVSRAVNSPRNDTPALVDAVAISSA